MFVNFRTLHKLKYKLCSKEFPKVLPKRCYQHAVPIAMGYQPTEVETVEKVRQVTSHQSNTLKKGHPGTFRMILPPPNVTGDLHLGHAFMATIQDVICRQRRKLGFNVEWIPGTDHAGIATQVVVEKKILKELGLSRQQIGRKKFLEEVWRWKREKRENILEDLRNLGCSLKWDEEYFTMDERQALAVNTAFVKLFDDGFIKRKKSLVNWSCSLESAISDIEVESLEIKEPTYIAVPGYQKNVLFGRIFDISYPLCNAEGEITVSTTRPETMLGDVAVAVHPDDERYAKYRNMDDVKLWHPFRDEPIPLIFDTSVEREFGTGAVKITPAHDKNDFDVAQRNAMEAIAVFTDRGNILNGFAEFSGLPRFEARERILSALSEKKLLRSIRDHVVSLPICSRSNDIIEYMLRPQWFLSCRSMANMAISEVRSGRLQIVPKSFETEWYRWLEHCEDWCISRQLWWGHQIPMYLAQNAVGKSCWVAALTIEQALEKAQKMLNSEVVEINQDLDVLDTWFSAALLPFSVFNWPASDYKQRFPLDVMETGHDILFFWVARMTMLSLQLTGTVPFRKVLLNGIICDANGRKMSKSLGNVVTPKQIVQGATCKALQKAVETSHSLGVISEAELQTSINGILKAFPNGIKECGTDALRFTLCSHNIQNHFIKFDVAECHTNKLFINKIWQATRYILRSSARLKMPLHDIECLSSAELNKWDQWILSRLSETLHTCAQSFETYNLHAATAALKSFLYYNLCDIYLETSKADINMANSRGYVHCATLATCLSWALQTMAPFTPFVVEELLKHLPQDVRLQLGRYYNPNLEKEITAVLDTCQSIRQLMSQHNICKKHEPVVELFAHNAEALEIFKPHLAEVQALTLSNAVRLHDAGGLKSFDVSLSSTAGHLCSFGITTNELFSSSTKDKCKNEAQHLNEKKLKKLQDHLQRYRSRVLTEGFRKSASEEVQRKHTEKIHQLELEIRTIKSIKS